MKESQCFKCALLWVILARQRWQKGTSEDRYNWGPRRRQSYEPVNLAIILIFIFEGIATFPDLLCCMVSWIYCLLGLVSLNYFYIINYIIFSYQVSHYIVSCTFDYKRPVKLDCLTETSCSGCVMAPLWKWDCQHFGEPSFCN